MSRETTSLHNYSVICTSLSRRWSTARNQLRYLSVIGARCCSRAQLYVSWFSLFICISSYNQSMPPKIWPDFGASLSFLYAFPLSRLEHLYDNEHIVIGNERLKMAAVALMASDRECSRLSCYCWQNIHHSLWGRLWKQNAVCCQFSTILRVDRWKKTVIFWEGVYQANGAIWVSTRKK